MHVNCVMPLHGTTSEMYVIYVMYVMYIIDELKEMWGFYVT